jgi:predicted alpha/beta hydrolase
VSVPIFPVTRHVGGDVTNWPIPMGRVYEAPSEARDVETLDVRTADGWSLRADVREPKQVPIGVVVLAHALMARRSEFDRPSGAGLASFLVERGWRVVAFDFRGHGDSGPAPHEGASFGYDDFVTRDWPAIADFARSCAVRKRPPVLLGHSLGGHTALAAQGTGAIEGHAIVGLGAAPWLPQFEPSRAQWAAKRAAFAAAVAVCRRVGRFPARALRVGSDDVSRGCFEDFERFARTGAWTSADGRVDYLASLGRVRVPVLQVVSEGDRRECRPECGERLAALCGGPHEVLRITSADDGGRPPGHMGMVISRRVRGTWDRVERWMRAAVG